MIVSLTHLSLNQPETRDIRFLTAQVLLGEECLILRGRGGDGWEEKVRSLSQKIERLSRMREEGPPDDGMEDFEWLRDGEQRHWWE